MRVAKTLTKVHNPLNDQVRHLSSGTDESAGRVPRSKDGSGRDVDEPADHRDGEDEGRDGITDDDEVGEEDAQGEDGVGCLGGC